MEDLYGDKNINPKNFFVNWVRCFIQRYNPESYWRMRAEVVNPDSKKSKLLRLFYLFRIKRMDAFNNATFGTDLGKGATFETPPILPHGLKGIFISEHARIGKNCTILHQVTIMPAIIGDNCNIGVGAKIIAGRWGKRPLRIGNNVRIGANAVVVTDVPDNCTAVGVPARVIRRDEDGDKS